MRPSVLATSASTTSSTSARLLVFLAAVFAIPSSTRAQLVPGTRSLTIKEVLGMVSTETAEEFEDSDASDAKAEELWMDAVTFEWNRADMADLFYEKKFPYLLCHVGRSADGTRNLSGLQRKDALAAALDITEEEDMHFRPLYNEEDYLCVYGQLLASVASAITGEQFIVQPIVPSMKYMKGSVEGMMREVDFKNNGELGNPSLDMVMCPGVAVAEDAAAARTPVEGSPREELSGSAAEDIIKMLVPQTKAVQLANAISDTYYLTSEVYADAKADAGEEVTERSKMWTGLIRDYKESEKCYDVFEEHLRWTLQRARDPSADSALLSVEFNVTGNTEDDVGCMLTLSLAIAAHPDVCSLESRGTVRTANAVAQWLVQSEVEGRRPFFDAGLDGTGQVVAVSDTGIDPDNCYFADAAERPGTNSLNMAARKIVQYMPFVDNDDQEYGHGTHVAGTVAGKRGDGPGMADGVAPGAKLAFLDIGDRNGALSLPLDRQLLQVGRPDCRLPGNDACPKARIHSASWGGEQNSYTTQARNFDQYMYDNADVLIVVAAGNSGAGDAPNTVGSPATGKNVLTVGAHHSAATSNPGGATLGPSYVADFSSRGPTSDGRTKPDIIAPGKAVLSAGALPGRSGECDPSERPEPKGREDGVLSLQGTSMATPVVSGTAAIVRQYFEEGYYPTGTKNETNIYKDPTGALIKAVLMNGAQFLNGVDNGGDGVTDIKPYDNNQNFGRLALQHSIYLPGKTQIQMNVWDKRTVADQGEEVQTIAIDKSDGCAYDKLSVTLVWVEEGSPPGCTRCVLNDLDLTVTLGNKTHYPNGKGGPDRRNSAERVVVDGVAHGDVATIRVVGHNLVQSSQRYSLVATGCFGGVANTNFDDQCSAFECDDSEKTRMELIMMAVFIPLGVILLFCCGICFWRRR